MDFGAESAVPLTKKYDNILISQTFSKSRSFAGGRLGFAIGNQELIRDLITLQYSTNPYSVNTLSLILGSAAMEEEAYYRKNAEIIQKNRKYTAETLTSMGFEVLPSKANFVFCPSSRNGWRQALSEIKRERGSGSSFHHRTDSGLC